MDDGGWPGLGHLGGAWTILEQGAHGAPSLLEKHTEWVVGRQGTDRAYCSPPTPLHSGPPLS